MFLRHALLGSISVVGFVRCIECFAPEELSLQICYLASL